MSICGSLSFAYNGSQASCYLSHACDQIIKGTMQTIHDSQQQDIQQRTSWAMATIAAKARDFKMSIVHSNRARIPRKSHASSSRRQKAKGLQGYEVEVVLVVNRNCNQFTRYVPIHRHISTEEMAKKNFPAIEENPELYTKISDLLMNKQWAGDKLNQWTYIKKNFILYLDLEQLVVVRMLCIMYGFNKHILHQLKNHFHVECDNKIILHSIQTLNLYKDQYNIKIIQNMPFSLFEHDEINENNLQINDKLFFCNRCMIYHCFRHDLLPLHEGTYQNPYINYDVVTKTASKLIQFHNYLLYAEGNIAKLKQIHCSQHCYLKLTNAEYEQIKQTCIPIDSQFVQSIIAMGIQSLAYDICAIAQRLPQKYNCKILFVYMIEQLKIQKKFIEKMIYDPQVSNRKKMNPKPQLMSQQIYIPCKHIFNDSSEVQYQEDCSDCRCGQQWKFCDKYCLCNINTCKIRRVGCVCQGECKEATCICWAQDAECDPDLCTGCFVLNSEGLFQKKQKQGVSCRNNEIFFQINAKTVIGNSKICEGYGLFLVEPVDKNDLITQYIGEIISDPEQEVRAFLDNPEHFFAFEIVDKDRLIDAKYFGNKARFINHSKLKNNCEVKNMYSQGNVYIGIYALNELMPGNELLINYDGKNELGEKYPWINNGLTPIEIQNLKKH